MGTTFSPGPETVARARVAAARARVFCSEAGHPLGAALVDQAWFDGDATAVLTALAAYQNPDGGFGRGLEVDIGAPESNAFATRLAMQALLWLHERPDSTLVAPLAAWLDAHQHADGDWHFSEATAAGTLASWFSTWTFPSLNPACCVTAAATRLGLATPRVRARTSALFESLASQDDLASGDFYTLLPYAEYVPLLDGPDRERWLELLVATISRLAREGAYPDAGHFFEHVLGGGDAVLERLDPALLTTFTERLLDEQSDDGGWPTPYDQRWRPWFTAESAVFLARLARGVD